MNPLNVSILIAAAAGLAAVGAFCVTVLKYSFSVEHRLQILMTFMEKHSERRNVSRAILTHLKLQSKRMGISADEIESEEEEE